MSGLLANEKQGQNEAMVSYEAITLWTPESSGSGANLGGGVIFEH
jgi:hypothetical protein